MKQIEKYNAFLKDNEGDLKAGYVNACKVLDQLGKMTGAKSVSGLVKDVAEKNRDIVVDKSCRLVVFGFDGDQRDNRLEELKSKLTLSHPLIAKGDPKGLKLPR